MENVRIELKEGLLSVEYGTVRLECTDAHEVKLLATGDGPPTLPDLLVAMAAMDREVRARYGIPS